MQTVDFNDLDLNDAWFEEDPAMRVRVNFPFSAATGNRNSAVVYFEIDPGHCLATHTDSAEEIVLLLAGEVEANLDGQVARMAAGQAVLIPALAPHGIRNIGQQTARCVGFFAASALESVFDQSVMPFGVRCVVTPPAAAKVEAMS